MRVPGDTIFAAGALVLVAFVFTTRSAKKRGAVPEAVVVPAIGD
jgi:hypothetical protein